MMFATKSQMKTTIRLYISDPLKFCLHWSYLITLTLPDSITISSCVNPLLENI